MAYSISVEGGLYKYGPLVTRIFPTGARGPQPYQFFLDTEQPIHPPYTAVHQPSGVWPASGGSTKANDEEAADITKINEFLKGHIWAYKWPVRLIYYGEIRLTKEDCTSHSRTLQTALRESESIR